MKTSYQTTLPGLLVHNARQHPAKVAMREKDRGIWQKYTYEQYLQITSEFAAGLKKLGLGRDDILIIIGDNRPEWLWAELAIQGIGGVSLGLYQDSPAQEVRFIFELSQTRLVVAEDQEQVDKILSIKEELPDLDYIVYHDPKGLECYEAEGLLSFDQVREMGRDRAGEYPEWTREVSPEDVCLIVTTSGTTGRPKLAMLSHTNLLSMACNLGQADPKYSTDEFVSFLPLAWIGEQMMAAGTALLFGFCVNFPEEPDTVQENIREIGPNLIFSPPRIWENMAASVRVKIMETTPLKRFLYHFFLPWGYAYADTVLNGQKPGFLQNVKYRVAWFALFRALKDRLGFSNIRSASTGGAPLGPDTFRFFHALGVNLKQIYGQTEIAGISCIHTNGEVDFDTVGHPIPETDIKISEQGEILSRSPAVFKGYLHNPEASAETLEDGWLKSGDAGYFKDNGQLVIIDRLSDVMKLKNGTTFSPQFIENKIKFSTYVQEAVVIGRDREFITAIVCLDAEIAGRWAEAEQITYTTYQDLVSRPELYALIKEELESLNDTLQQGTQIRSFALLYKELDADDGELTRTRKIRRTIIEERYGELIEALYSHRDSVHLTACITYQDGCVREMNGAIRIQKIEI